MENEPDIKKQIFAGCRAIGFAVIGGLSAAGAIEVVETDTNFGLIFAAYPALISLITTVVAVDTWENIFSPSKESEVL